MSKNIEYSLKLSLLGPFSVESDRDSLSTDSWKSKKALTLFKYLIFRKHKVQKDILIELLWPDSCQDQTHNLHTIIYYIRKKLRHILHTKKDLIKYSKGMYWFERKELCWLDFEEFETLYREALRLEQEGNDLSKAVEHFKKSISLYRGDFLQEDLYADWTVNPRQFFRDMYIDAVLRCSNLLARIYRDYQGAVQICQKALSIDPYREELYQTLITYLAKEGLYIEATRKYQEYARMLYEEFGLQPGEEIKNIFLNLNIPANNKLNIFGELSNEINKPGPFLCDRQTFELIYELQGRRQKRNNEVFTLIRIIVQEGSGEKKNRLLRILQNSLRQGDVLCGWDRKTFGLLLFAAGRKETASFKKRLEQILAVKNISPVKIKISVIKEAGGLCELPGRMTS